MLGAQYRCTLCTFRSYTLGILQAHCKHFHCGLNLSKGILNSKHLNNKYTNSKQYHVSSKKRLRDIIDCLYCKHTSTRRGNLQQHIISCHSNTRLFKCPQCRKRFPSKHRLKTHITSHCARKFKCHSCSYTATNVGTIYKHAKEVHTGLTKFQCHLCKTRFKRYSTLLFHIKNVHLPNIFSCHICYKKFSRKAKLTQHMITHSCKPVPASCRICHKTYTSMQNLQRHISLQHTFHADKKSRCLICNLRFTDKNTLTGHMQRKHSGKRLMHKCQACSKVYLSQGGLRVHIKMKHTKIVKRHQCTKCSASFEMKEKRTKHMKRHGRKTVTCGQCSATFSDMSALTIHQYTHGKSMKHECAICKLKCRHPSELRAHLKTHTNDRMVKCIHTLCDKLFTEKRFMLGHWREVHLERTRRCLICGHTATSSGHLQVSAFMTLCFLWGKNLQTNVILRLPDYKKGVRPHLVNRLKL